MDQDRVLELGFSYGLLKRSRHFVRQLIVGVNVICTLGSLTFSRNL